MKIKTGKKKTNIILAKNAIMQYAGKLHKKYVKKKISIDSVRNLINYANL